MAKLVTYRGRSYIVGDNPARRAAMSRNKKIIIAGGVLGGLAIAVGAILLMNPSQQTGNRYPCPTGFTYVPGTGCIANNF